MTGKDGFPTDSTYRAPITVLDRDGDPLSGLDTADIRYRISTEQNGEKLFEATEADSEVQVDVQNGVVTVEIPASEVDWTGSVWEELRVSPSGSVVVLQRTVRFYEVATTSE
jgi:hypothetical protein